MSKKIFKIIERSSQIKGLNHDLPESRMEVKFHTEAVYSYHPVTFKQYNDFLVAKSIGSHFYKNFKSNPLITATKIKDGN